MHGVSELGFPKEHRDLNIQRIGYVASEITRNGGIVVLLVAHTYREEEHGEVIRIISARKATRHERQIYEHGY